MKIKKEKKFWREVVRMSRHIKRIAAPKTWQLLRKAKKYVIKPLSSQRIEHTIPIVLAIRDLLNYAKTASEVKKLLNEKQVMVDGKIVKDKKRGVALMDVVSFPKIKEHYRVLLNKQGKLYLKKITEQESKIKICKITAKKMIGKNKKQYTTHDGCTIITDKDYKVSDSLVIEIPEQKITKHISFDKNKIGYVILGKYAGQLGKIEEITQEMKRARVKISTKQGKIETLRKYVLIIGDEKPVISVEE